MLTKSQRQVCVDRYISLWRQLRTHQQVNPLVDQTILAKPLVNKASVETSVRDFCREWQILCEMLWLSSMVTWTPMDFVTRDFNFTTFTKNPPCRIMFCGHCVTDDTMDKCLECGVNLTSIQIGFKHLIV